MAFLFLGVALFGCAKNTSGESSATYAPSKDFALSNWNLTAPADASSNSEVITVSSTQLASGFLNTQFYENESGGLVLGARTELREIYTGPSADADHNWTSSVGGTLSGICTIQALPNGVDEIAIAQIRNQNAAFALLLYRPSHHDLVLSLATTPSSSLANSPTERTTIAGNVNLNVPINFQIHYAANILQVSANGDSETFTIDQAWANAPMYFKLGANDATQVIYSRFSVIH